MTEDTDCNPAAYRRNCARNAEKLRLIGATHAELALFFGVGVATIERWADEHKDFEWALQVLPTALSVTGEDIGRLLRVAGRTVLNRGRAIKAPPAPTSVLRKLGQNSKQRDFTG